VASATASELTAVTADLSDMKLSSWLRGRFPEGVPADGLDLVREERGGSITGEVMGDQTAGGTSKATMPSRSMGSRSSSAPSLKWTSRWRACGVQVEVAVPRAGNPPCMLAIVYHSADAAVMV
jgi:hypothetical protein